MKWILVIYESPDMASVVEACVASASPPAAIVRVANLHEARDAVARHGAKGCQLIVSSLAPPADAEQPLSVDRGVATAISFLRDVRGATDAPPCILIDPAPTFALNEQLTGLNRVLIMAIGDVGTYLTGNARSMIAREPLPNNEEAHLMDVDISISGEICNWQLSGKRGVGVAELGSIKLNKKNLDRVLRDSRAVGQLDQSGEVDLKRQFVRELGQDLYCLIRNPDGTGDLWEAVSHYTNRMTMLEKTRFRFQVDHTSSQLLVEALSQEEKYEPATDGNHGIGDAASDARAVPPNGEYWMLRTPIMRRFGAKADRPPLFKDHLSREQPVQCLIILGNPSRFEARGAVNKSYYAIRNATEEVEWLADYLTADHELFGLAVPKVMRYDEHATGTFGSAVRKTLQGGRWQMIHYSGHSDIGANGAGYLVLGDHEDDQIDIEEFACSAAHAQFIFLNSCRSADVRFVQRSVERSIPAVAGYAWPIRDDIAAEFSCAFYRNLFGNRAQPLKRYLEYAFLLARRDLHEAYDHEGVCLGPLLFMQSMSSEPNRPVIQRRPT